jgi:glycosyltransferase involved in cell wall biosynthesis
VVILEPELYGIGGHYFHGIQQLISVLHPIRPTVVSSVHLRASPFPADIEVLPLFSSWEGDAFGLGPKAKGNGRWARKRLRAMSQFIRRTHWYAADRLQPRVAYPQEWPELASVLQQSGAALADHIIVPTAPASLVFELAEHLLIDRGAAMPHIHARFLIGSTPKRRRSFDHLFRRLAQVPALRRRLHFYVETPAMARFLSHRYQVEPDLFPHVLAPSPIPTDVPRPSSGSVTFGCLGPPRKDKGFERLVPILRIAAARAAQDRKRLAFIVQLDAAGSPSAINARRDLDRLAAESGICIEMHTGPLSSQQYYELLDRVDCLLLPYVDRRYELSGSGIVFEALAHAKPFICTAGLSFSDYIRGNAIEAADNSAFADAIVSFTRDPAPYMTAAQLRAQAYREALARNVLVQRVRGRAGTAVQRA